MRKVELGEITVREGEKGRLEFVPDVKSGYVPDRLVIPHGFGEGLDVCKISVVNQKQEVDFIIKSFRAVLFDGDVTRRSPYGQLPHVSADPGSPLVIEVENVSTMPVVFKAEAWILEEGIDYPER